MLGIEPSTFVSKIDIQTTTPIVHNAIYSACLLNVALSNAVCLYNASSLPMTYANAFYFHDLSWFIDKQFVHFMY